MGGAASLEKHGGGEKGENSGKTGKGRGEGMTLGKEKLWKKEDPRKVLGEGGGKKRKRKRNFRGKIFEFYPEREGGTLSLKGVVQKQGLWG